MKEEWLVNFNVVFVWVCVFVCSGFQESDVETHKFLT